MGGVLCCCSCCKKESTQGNDSRTNKEAEDKHISFLNSRIEEEELTKKPSLYIKRPLTTNSTTSNSGSIVENT